MRQSVAIFTSQVLLSLIVWVPQGYSKDKHITSPQAGTRTYAQNYKDMLLAECVAVAYKNEPNATKDAGSNASALMDWTYIDIEKDPTTGKSLVSNFLARDYYNPLAESEMKGIRFDFLKCLDLYHSVELEAQVKRIVINPKQSYKKKKLQQLEKENRQ